MKKITDLKVVSRVFLQRPDGRFQTRDYLLKPTLSPYLVYTILKEKFGSPEVDMIDEDKQQWEWSFSYQDFFVEIYDWKLLSTSIAVYHSPPDEEKSKALAEKINEVLEKEAAHKKGHVRILARTATRKILENPFNTYYSAAVSLIDYGRLIDKMTMTEYRPANKLDEHAVFLTLSERVDLWENKEDLFRSAFLMLLSSFEGFLNILYELYLQPELREERIFARIAREQIDVKLRLVPTYCHGFKVKAINNEDPRFKNYFRLVNLRNDYIHANLIKRLERYIVEEDGFTFVIENEETSDIPTNFRELKLEHVELARKYIDDVIALVFESMETKARKEFQAIIFDSDIEVIEEDGVLIPRQ